MKLQKKQPKPIKHVMIDLETLSLEPTAYVFQIGLVFNIQGIEAAYEIDIDPALLNTFYDINPDTVAWHRQDPERAANLNHCELEGVSHKAAGEQLLYLIETATEGRIYALNLWSSGINFDFPILEHMLKSEGLKPNWPYNSLRDFRTARELFKHRVPASYKNSHTAMSDALNQHRHLMKLINSGVI